MVKNNTADTACLEGNPWKQEDCIRWVEWRVRELTIQNGEYVDERSRWLLDEKTSGGRRLALGDEVADYAVWLLKVRDGLSWHQIAYRFFPFATEEVIEKYELKVRRMYNRVERKHPGSKMFKPPRLSKDDELLLRAVMLGIIPIYVTDAPTAPDSDLQS
jgi:hypothetical protein